MELTLSIPDDLAADMAQGGGDLARRAIDAFALEELRAGRITEGRVRKMLGLARIELDGFLRAHGISQECALEDFEQQRQALNERGL